MARFGTLNLGEKLYVSLKSLASAPTVESFY